MADVLSIANDRRAELNAEIAKLDKFIEMGESLASGRFGSAQSETRSSLGFGRGNESGARVAGGAG